ncbi:hypothetical protein [Pseudoalteromonas sp. T1lg10]|uniref:hypothetical protein n=1 Tax=Pseudoalteromonas sp. T1lg10 TaxID=2077093 RepID=UPI000CF67150|nr:hypothetical protein [Pseudoalteromonas sp. T1lg10]
MELLERKYVRELASQHNTRLQAAALDNTTPQLLLDFEDELNELTKALSEEDRNEFDRLYYQEMDALAAMQEVGIENNKLKIAELEAKTAELELNEAQREAEEAKLIGYIVAFVVVFFVFYLVFEK